MQYTYQSSINNNSLKIFSRKEVQEILGIGKSKMLSLIQSGELTAFRLSENGPYRIHKEDLEEFICHRKYC